MDNISFEDLAHAMGKAAAGRWIGDVAGALKTLGIDCRHSADVDFRRVLDYLWDAAPDAADAMADILAILEAESPDLGAFEPVMRFEEAGLGLDMSEDALTRYYKVAHSYEATYLERAKRYSPIARLIKTGDRVLDIGCGDGVFLDLARQAGASRTVGIDVDPAMTDLIARKGHEAKLAEIDQIDWAALGQFDFIAAFHIIEHMTPKDAIALLDRITASLSRVGRLYLITPNMKHPVQAIHFWLDITHVRPYPELLLCTLLQSAGFAHVQAGDYLGEMDLWAYACMDPADRIPAAREGEGRYPLR